MRHGFAILSVALVAALISPPLATSAQEVGIATSPDTSAARTAKLAFSKNGRLLHEIRSVSATSSDDFEHVRAITYDASTGATIHSLNLGPHTDFLSATSDGQTAIISVDRNREGVRAHLLLVDVETGKTQDLPSKWFDANDQSPYAQISGDGRLVSTYMESGANDSPMIVNVYDWRTKKLVARQTSGYISAGGAFAGGVTEDGKIEFSNNRVGSEIVDSKTGRLIARFGPNSHRSLDGVWVVEFPNAWYDDAPAEAVIKNGGNGKVTGKLDLHIEDTEKWAWGPGAFCGTSGRFIAATADKVQAFEIPSGKKIADIPATAWRDMSAINGDPTVTVACSSNGKRVAIRSGERLTLHDLN